MKFFLSIFCLVFCLVQVKANASKIEVHLKDQSHEDIVFFAGFEPFYQLQDTIFVFKAGKEQQISFSVDIESTKCIQAFYGPYECFFFVEPGASYIISLPEISKYDESWKTNPYFQKSVFIPEIKRIDNYTPANNEIELNQAIKTFYNEYLHLYNNLVLNYYETENIKPKRDTSFLEKFTVSKVSDQNYYDAIIFYHEGILSFITKKFQHEEFLLKYFKNKEINFNMPGYSQLFRLVFSDYYDYLRQMDSYSKIFAEFTRISYHSLRNYLKQDELMKSDSIFETILLHEIYNAYYSGNFNKKRMISFVDSVYCATNIPIIRTSCAYLRDKFTHLQPGFQAPGFRLVELSGDSLSLSSYEGNYLLLGFCQLENISCLKEFEYLKYLYSKHHEYLKILTIIAGNSDKDAENFLEQNNISWEVIRMNPENPLFTEYEVKSFPVFYLIGKDGKLILSPSPNPSLGLEQQLFSIMKSRGDI